MSAEKGPLDGARDFAYIKPSGRRLSEYEAVIMHVQPNHPEFDGPETFVLRRDGTGAWNEDSTALRAASWYDFRDPAQMWQRPYIVRQTEQEKTIERLVHHWAETGTLKAMDPAWAAGALGDLYVPCSFYENGLFRSLIITSRETLSDLLSAAMMFDATDKARHAQDIILYHLELLEVGVKIRSDNGKEAWLRDPRLQSLRRLTERVLACRDWGELAVAVNLVVEPLVSRLIYDEILGKGAPAAGDVATPVILAEAASDRKRNLEWTQALVTMCLDDPDHGEPNRAVIGEWLRSWLDDVRTALDDVAVFAPLAGVDPVAAVSAVLEAWPAVLDQRLEVEKVTA
jgi:methane monooxygenase component A beta chain/propane monooxygenase small subunit